MFVEELRNWEIAESTLDADIEFTIGAERPSPSPDALLLDEDEFENLLRPAFQQDEWILFAVGAVLGFLVGELQVQIMLAAR